ncbi:MAG: hypothetical protein JNM07_02850 [Phycisphaerae bacterium]|nr:hypothetical protein [Phycisphaerae bacterium]
MTESGTTRHAIAARAAELLARQCAAASELNQRADRVGRLVDESGFDPGEVLEFLAARQSLVDELAADASEFEGLRLRWDSVLAGAEPRQRDELTRSLERCATLVGQLMAADRALSERLEARRRAIADELLELDRGRDALGAYRCGSVAVPAFRDQEA